ncbi:NADH dehydrogenase [ubiquinone] 1 beta subcomplex subunit 8, mitochondrial-like [Haliotis rubra]|uniref:NADH dehydrogenase [ubiquinone] 1 beta subcomplex subunit 8, mitochondrial-like n=1 Tax=Haliotis rubra TaxID=36100 RepID=UPI001EE5B325|nr:NADH dehydrogenase [ubiquinone] 1 beta subcomplex subunit 8, mitochondrial-like [Haliotis rubra]
MATFRSVLHASKVFRPCITNRSIKTSAVVSNWNKDWKPGPYPMTPEERANAAKRYGLRVEDYDVYADDGTGYGDYPKLPHVSGDVRDPNEDWDIPEIKRNYGEPLHVDHDMIGEDRYNINANPRLSYRTMFLSTGAFLGTILAIYILTEPYPHFLPVMPKQHPFNNLYLENGGEAAQEKAVQHYTFEPAD